MKTKKTNDCMDQIAITGAAPAEPHAITDKDTEKRYKVADSMRQNVRRIEDYVRTTLDMHEEFGILAPGQEAYFLSQLDKAQAMRTLADGETVDGRTIHALKTWIDGYTYVLEHDIKYYTYA